MFAAIATAGAAARGAATSVVGTGGGRIVWQAVVHAAKWVAKQAAIWVGIETAATLVKKGVQGIRRVVRGKPSTYAMPVTWETRVKQAPARTARFFAGSLTRFAGTAVLILSLPVMALAFLTYGVGAVLVGGPTFVVSRLRHEGDEGLPIARRSMRRAMKPFLWFTTFSVATCWDGGLRMIDAGTAMWHHDYNTDLNRKFIFVPTTGFKNQATVVNGNVVVVDVPAPAQATAPAPAAPAPAAPQAPAPEAVQPEFTIPAVTPSGLVTHTLVDEHGIKHVGIAMDADVITKMGGLKWGETLFWDFYWINPEGMDEAYRQLRTKLNPVVGSKQAILADAGWKRAANELKTNGPRPHPLQAQAEAAAAAKAATPEAAPAAAAVPAPAAPQA